VKVTADTNILARAIIEDDPVQAGFAQDLLQTATVVALPVTVLVEFCWVAQRVYKVGRPETVKVIRDLIGAANVATDKGAVEAGLAMLEAGGDFADGVIAYSGRWLGGETFVSLDKEAVRLLAAQGQAAQIPV